MWIRVLLLVSVAVGLNWLVSEEIRKNHKQGFLGAAHIQPIDHTQNQAQRYMLKHKMLAFHRRELSSQRKI